MNEAVIVGEAVAGEAAKLRRKIEAVVKTINTSAFDAAELFAKAKKNRSYVGWGFNTLSEYFRSLDISERKAQYLTRIAEVMGHEKVHVARADYEPLGIAKLREITSLDPEGQWTTPAGETFPMAEYIQGFVFDRTNESFETIQKEVRVLKGLIGENDLTHFNLMFTRLTKENTIDAALAKMRLELGPVGKDGDGVAIEATDSRCIELICVRYLTEETDDDAAISNSTDINPDEPVSNDSVV
jgi:hypothetical protein